MKKLFSFLAILTISISPLGSAFAEAQTPSNQFAVSKDCTIPLRDLNTVQNFPPDTGPIIAFGDSLTAGVGATPGQDYVSELERLSDVDIINEGISGNTTLDALARLDRDVLSQNPSTVIVWLGGNDILNRYYQRLSEEDSDTVIGRLIDAIFRFFGKDPDREEIITEAETFENIEEIIERIQATGAVVILVGMDGEPLNNNLGGRYEALAEANDVIFIPDVLENILGRPALTSDPVHPNNRGYDIVAQRIYNGFACVLEDTNGGGEEEPEEPEEEDPEPPRSNSGTKRVCVDTDNDGYKECSYVRGGSTTPDPEEEEEPEEEEPEPPRSNSGTKRVCVDTDNDGYKECSYQRQ
jgi:acyl-CoA thioesterase I